MYIYIYVYIYKYTRIRYTHTHTHIYVYVKECTFSSVALAAAPFFLSFFSFFLSLPLPLHDSRLFTCSPTSNRHARVGAYTQQSARFPFQNFTPRPFSPPRHRQFRTCNGRVACHSIAHACWNPHTHVRAARNQRDCVRAPRPLGARFTKAGQAFLRPREGGLMLAHR